VRRLASLFLGILLTTVPLSALGAGREFGIDYSRLSTKSAGVQARSLAGIRSLGATWFRDVYVAHTPDGLDDFVNELRMAKQLKLKLLVGLLPASDDFDGIQPENGGDEFLKLCGWRSGSRKLSLIDLNKFSQRIGSQFAALKAAGVTVEAFEVGNEFDWICFNGDVPNGHEASQAEFMTAVRAYAHYLKTAGEAIRAYYPNAKILTFPLASLRDAWDTGMHHFSNPARMIAQLRNLDGYNYLDNASYHVYAYGLHVYPTPDMIAKTTREKVGSTVAILNDKPIWITEWGLKPSRFPDAAGETRAQAAAEFYATLDEYGRTVTFGPIFYYSYPTGLIDGEGNLLPDASAMLPR
jgi:Glycosyl hydrolase catalytic core